MKWVFSSDGCTGDQKKRHVCLLRIIYRHIGRMALDKALGCPIETVQEALQPGGLGGDIRPLVLIAHMDIRRVRHV